MLIKLMDQNDVDILVNTDHVISAIPTKASAKCLTLLVMVGDDNLLVQQDIDEILAQQKA